MYRIVLVLSRVDRMAARWRDDSVPTRVATITAGDRKWSGLMKRAPHTAAGHEAAEGGALSERWSATQAARSAM